MFDFCKFDLFCLLAEMTGPFASSAVPFWNGTGAKCTACYEMFMKWHDRRTNNHHHPQKEHNGIFT